MSESFSVVKINDPRLRVTDPKAYAAQVGYKFLNPQKISPSSYGTSINSWVLNSGGQNYGVDRRWTIKWFFTVDITGNSSPLNFNDGTISLRQFPVTSCTNTISLSINNQTLTVQRADLLHYLTRYSSDPEYQVLSGSGLTCPDQSQAYSDLNGASNNPLNSYTNGNFDGYMPRGAYNSEFTVLSNATGAASFTVDIVEPVYIGPLIWGNMDSSCFVNINQMILTYNMFNLSRIISSSLPGLTINVSLRAQPILLTNIFTFQPDQPIPSTQLLNYQSFVPSISNDYTVSPGASVGVQSSSIQVNQVPEFILIFATEKQDNQTYSSPDVCGRLTNLNVTYLNQGTLFSTMDEYQIYQLCVKNGLRDVSYQQFRSKVGSVICLLGSDLSLDQGLASGVAGLQTTFQVNATLTNISNRSITYNLFVLPILQGVLELPSSLQAQLNPMPITRDQIAAAPYVGTSHIPVYGSGFFDTLKDIARGIHGFVRENKLISKGLSALSNAPYVGPLASAVAPVAKTLGYGQGGALLGGNMIMPDQYSQLASQIP